jgi:hypothetical protein
MSNVIKHLFFFLFMAFILLGCDSLDSEREFENKEFYNKEVNRDILKSYFPKQQNYNFSTSGNSPYIKGDCPSIGEDKKLTFQFGLTDTTILKGITVLNVFIEKKDSLNSKQIWRPIIDQYFVPDLINQVQIKNELPKGQYKVWLGFYLTKDSVEIYPKLYKKICYLEVE